MSRISLGAVIVNYGTPDLVEKCVSSLLKHSVVDAESIVVVDNRSPDNSVERLSASLPSGVKLIASKKNAGFGAGLNIGFASCTQDYILALNPDTYFIDDSIKKALSVITADPSIGIAGLDLRYPSGEKQFSARKFYSLFDIFIRRMLPDQGGPFKSRVRQHLMMDSWEDLQPFTSDWVMGTGFIIRRSLFNNIQGMDERYFLYMEDVDLCARVWESGHKVYCVPGAILVHDHQRSSATNPLSRAGKAHLKSLMLFRQRFRVPVFRTPTVKELRR